MNDMRVLHEQALEVAIREVPPDGNAIEPFASGYEQRETAFGAGTASGDSVRRTTVRLQEERWILLLRHIFRSCSPPLA
jgi:hypothetical protein